MSKLFRSIGIAVRSVLFGQALLIAFVTMYAMQSGARIFRYAGF
jgi:hypothetical protein